jgi:colanic acid/amylovoran biosynthesis glycosyltransferase
MKNTIRVLHFFNSYLYNTENWAYNLIYHLPDTKVVIASKNFVRCNFYPDKFEYIEFPLKQFEDQKATFCLRLVNKFISAVLGILYPRYVKKKCGACDIAHSHFATVGWEYMRLVKRVGIPYVVSFYGYDYQHIPFRKPVWKQRYRQLFQCADLFLCEGKHGAQILEKIGCPPEKIRVARLGVDVDQIPFWKRTKEREELHLLQIAKFTAKKGQKYTIDAFKMALENRPNMSLTFVGLDPWGIRSELLAEINSTPAAGKVFFQDSIDHKYLHEFMKDFQVFIHPSCYTEQMDCEGGAPVVLLDAQATGMPVIATTHCDIPDEVLHKKTGLLSPEKDSVSLVGSIKFYYHMGQADYNIFAQNSREHVEKNYNINLNSSRLRSIYHQLMYD